MVSGYPQQQYVAQPGGMPPQQMMYAQAPQQPPPYQQAAAQGTVYPPTPNYGYNQPTADDVKPPAYNPQLPAADNKILDMLYVRKG